jgi:hypothetical protein
MPTMDIFEGDAFSIIELTLDIAPDLVAMMAAEIATGERAVSAAMREAGSGLKTA